MQQKLLLSNVTCSPMMSSYRLELPIDSIPKLKMSKAKREPLLELYRTWIGMLIWLPVSTQPDLTPVVSLLSTYQSEPSSGILRWLNMQHII